MAKKILLLFIFITTLIYAETKPSTDVFEYRLKQLENKYITIEIQNEMLIERKIKLESKIDILENKNKENVEVYKKLLENNENLYSNQLNSFNLTLYGIGLVFAIITFFGFKEIKDGIDKKVADRIDSKADNKIIEIENAIEESKKLKLALNEIIATHENVLTRYEKVIENFKNKSLESFTDEDIRKLDLIAREASNKENKTDEDWFLIGLEYQKNEQVDEAIKAYQQAIQENTKNSGVYHNIGIAYNKKDLQDEAIEAFQKAIELNYNKPTTHFNLGVLYTQKKLYEKAINSYKSSISVDSNYESAYINLFELALISNSIIENKITVNYLEKFQTNLDSFMLYEMITIFKEIKNQKNQKIELIQWKNKYKDINFRCSFDDLTTWIEKEVDSNIKQNLKEALEFFIKHQDKFKNNQK